MASKSIGHYFESNTVEARTLCLKVVLPGKGGRPAECRDTRDRPRRPGHQLADEHSVPTKVKTARAVPRPAESTSSLPLVSHGRSTIRTCVSTGHVEERRQLMPDRWASIPAVGARENAAPLETFEKLLAGVGPDGSRAHALSDVCAIPP